MSELNWSHFKPEYSGKPDENAEAHLLRTNNSMESHAFPEVIKVQRFCKKLNFLKIRTNFYLSSQAFACLQHGFLRNVENVYIHNLVTPKWCMGKCFSK